MKLTFLGTRGETKKVRTPRHCMHSSLMVSYRGARIMIDCGDDWLGKLDQIPRPGAILVTHAHPDHAWGLKQGAPCPVYASTYTWEIIGGYPIADRQVAPAYEAVSYRGFTITCFPVEHSLRAPANGYRITAGRRTLFYIPDVIYINNRAEALAGADLYVGDGATLTRSFVRRQGERLFGHAPVRTQLTWCMKEKVPRAIITHCGTEIVGGDDEKTDSAVREMARDRGVDAVVAYDGMELVL